MRNAIRPYKKELDIFTMRKIHQVCFERAYFIYYCDYYYGDWLGTLKDVIQDLVVLGAALQAKNRPR